MLTLDILKLFSPKPKSYLGQSSSPGPLLLFTSKEALAVEVVARNTPKLWMWDNFSHKAYALMGLSSNRREKMNNLMEVFAKDPLVVLQNYSVRWLSKTSDVANGTMQPQLVSGSPIGHAYTNFGIECLYSLLVQHCVREVSLSKIWLRAIYKLVWHWKHLMHQCGYHWQLFLFIELIGIMSYSYGYMRDQWINLSIWYACRILNFQTIFTFNLFYQYFDIIKSIKTCVFCFYFILINNLWPCAYFFHGATWIREYQSTW